MKQFSTLTLGCLVASMGLSGCVMDQGGMDTYSTSMRGQAMQVHRVQVVSVHYVMLKGESSIVGVGAGALAGGIAGSYIGKGRSQALGAVGGALAGGLLGDAAQRGMSQTRGVEITVRMQSGEEYAVVQKDRGENYQPGEWVRLLVDHQRRMIQR
jgi:outer membrane lipoprotein SlyB